MVGEGAEVPVGYGSQLSCFSIGSGVCIPRFPKILSEPETRRVCVQQSPHSCHTCNTQSPLLLGIVALCSKEGVIELSKMNRWIVGLTILALLAVGGVALAGGGLGSRIAENRASCPAAADGALRDADADGDGIVNSEDLDWVCPEDGSGCEEGAGTCLGLSADRPLDGSGAQCGAGQAVGGCRGGRF